MNRLPFETESIYVSDIVFWSFPRCVLKVPIQSLDVAIRPILTGCQETRWIGIELTLSPELDDEAGAFTCGRRRSRSLRASKATMTDLWPTNEGRTRASSRMKGRGDGTATKRTQPVLMSRVAHHL
jgi:hypothetical protein